MQLLSAGSSAALHAGLRGLHSCSSSWFPPCSISMAVCCSALLQGCTGSERCRIQGWVAPLGQVHRLYPNVGTNGVCRRHRHCSHIPVHGDALLQVRHRRSQMGAPGAVSPTSGALHPCAPLSPPALARPHTVRH